MDEDDSSADLPAYDVPAASDDDDPNESDDEFRNWSPSDATLEIWSGPNRDVASNIEIYLREVGIRSRIEKLPKGAGKLFVLPKDETRAREIVREVLDDAPPP
jgi:hypothetical protein